MKSQSNLRKLPPFEPENAPKDAKKSKKKNEEPPEAYHEEGEPWLMSYADMMTLLFGLFVILYAFAAAKVTDNDEDFVKVRRELARYFGGSVSDQAERLKNDVTEILENAGLGGGFRVMETSDGVVISLQSGILFDSGSAGLISYASDKISLLAGWLVKRNTQMTVRIEGHTDDNPIKFSKEFASNWDLSAARASSVVNIFSEAGFAPTQLSLVGFGESRPEVANRDAEGVPIPENQAANRRVVIRLYEEELPDAEPPVEDNSE